MKRLFLFSIAFTAASTVQFVEAANNLSLIPGSPNSRILSFHSDDEGSQSIDTLPDLEVNSKSVAKSIAASTPVYILSDSAILLRGVADMADALQRLPGINLRDYGGAGGLKTVSVRGLSAAHTGVSYDGIPLSDVRNGEIDLSQYGLQNVASISLSTGGEEDIFIPARAAASASRLSIASISDPTSHKGLSLNAKLRAGSFGLWNPFLRTGFSNGKNASCNFSGSFLHASNDYPFKLTNGTLQTSERRTNSLMNAATLEASSIWKPSPASSLTSKVYWHHDHRQLPGPVILYLNDSHERLRERNIFAQSIWKSRVSGVISIMAAGKFNWSASRYTDINGIYPGGALDQRYYQREVYLSGGLLLTPLPGLLASYSIDWIYNNLNSNLSSNTNPFRNSLLQALAVKYSRDRFSVTGRGILSWCHDDFRKRRDISNSAIEGHGNSNTRLSPELSANFRILPEQAFFVRASYKNIFRMPTFNELYFDNYGTLNLDPEITDQYNLGLSFELMPSVSPWLSSLRVTADGYFNSVKNKIVAIPYNLFKWTMTNFGKVRVLGFDFTLEGEFLLCKEHKLLLSANYSYQRAVSRTSRDRADWNQQLAYTPLNSGAASLTWLNPWVSVAAHATGCSARYATNNNLASSRIAGYVDPGIALFRSFSFRQHNVEIRGEILNLLNKQYQVIARYPMPGRHWQLSASFTL
ncbi:MAG: TonB-dependent receptor [Muribaculaceae bacterium]|nr:TonB-dependent receptor [Muribaculaceae bacterium]